MMTTRAVKLIHVGTAINIDILTGNVSGFLGSQKSDSCGHLFGRSQSLAWDVLGHLLLLLRRFDASADVCGNTSGSNGVDGNPVGGNLPRQGLGESENSCLGRAIVRPAKKAPAPRSRNIAHVNDAA